MFNETIEKKVFRKVRIFKRKPSNEKKLVLKKSCNGHPEKGDEAYFEDLAMLAAKRTKKYLLTLPLKKIFKEMT